MEFSKVIKSESELRAVLGEADSAAVVDKTLPQLDRHCLTFIGRAPFLLIASSNARGQMDISPKGDAPGFVRVLDPNTLVIPDRPGNRRYDTVRNLLDSPRIGVIFLIPGKRETLRVSGTAQVVHDAELLESLAAHGKVPALAIAVHVEEAFFHCAKCMVRSRLWQPDHWPSLEGLPTMAEAMKDAISIPLALETIEKILREDEEKRLY